MFLHFGMGTRTAGSGRGSLPDQEFASLDKYPAICSEFVWTGFDDLYPVHWMPEKPMSHILPHWNFPHRTGQVTPVFVYTSGDRLRWDDVVYEPGTLRVSSPGLKPATLKIRLKAPSR